MPGLPLPQEAIAFLQKTQSTDGGSFYDHMTDVVMKVRLLTVHRTLLTHLPTQVCTFVSIIVTQHVNLQILNDKPEDPVNLLQTSLMVKKTANAVTNTTQTLSTQVRVCATQLMGCSALQLDYEVYPFTSGPP